MQVYGFFLMQIYRDPHCIDLNIDLNNTCGLIMLCILSGHVTISESIACDLQ
jgi:hypothetical protein